MRKKLTVVDALRADQRRFRELSRFVVDAVHLNTNVFDNDEKLHQEVLDLVKTDDIETVMDHIFNNGSFTSEESVMLDTYFAAIADQVMNARKSA